MVVTNTDPTSQSACNGSMLTMVKLADWLFDIWINSACNGWTQLCSSVVAIPVALDGPWYGHREGLLGQTNGAPCAFRQSGSRIAERKLRSCAAPLLGSHFCIAWSSRLFPQIPMSHTCLKIKPELTTVLNELSLFNTVYLEPRWFQSSFILSARS